MKKALSLLLSFTMVFAAIACTGMVAFADEPVVIESGTVATEYLFKLPINLPQGSEWCKTEGLPNELNMSANGTISGTPKKAEQYIFTARAVVNGEIAEYNFSLKINKLKLIVKADDKQKNYGTANPEFTYTVKDKSGNDFVPVGKPLLSTEATIESIVNPYVISVSAGTLDVDNYEYEFINGKLMINRIDPTIEYPTQLNVVNKKNLTLADVEIPINGWVWDYPTAEVESGKSYAATFVTMDDVDYNCKYTTVTVNVTPCPHAHCTDVDVSADCTNSGYHSQVCDRCGETTEYRTIEAKGHSWSDWTSNNDSSFFKDGTKTHVCSECNETETVRDEGSSGFHNFILFKIFRLIFWFI